MDPIVIDTRRGPRLLHAGWVGLRPARAVTLLCLVFLAHRTGVQAQTTDERLGAEGARQVEQEFGVYHAGAATEYIRAIGNRLVDHLDDERFTFKFNMVNQPAPNAFALPGGWIYVSRGFMILANSEDELAGVIGHEIAHVTKRHGARRVQLGQAAAVLEVPGVIIGAIIGEDVGRILNVPIATLNQLSLSNYSRTQEKESDRLGIRLAAASGYDPRATASILTNLERDVEMLSGRRHTMSFFDTHPSTASRVSDVQEEAERIEWTPRPRIAKDRADFLQRLDGIWFGNDPVQGVFHGRQFLHPGYGLTITFPEGWGTKQAATTASAHAGLDDAVALIGIAPDADPDSLAAAFIDRLREEHEVEPLASGPIGSDTWSGFYVSLAEQDQRGGEISYLHYVWARIGGATFQLVGAGAARYEEALRQTALSLRPLTETERESIMGVRVRIVTALPGETAPELGTRTGNRWTVEYTLLMNGLAGDAVFSGGELIKVARTERYPRGERDLPR